MPQAEFKRKEHSGDLEGCFSEEVTFKLRPGWPVGASVGGGGRGNSRCKGRETRLNMGAAEGPARRPCG